MAHPVGHAAADDEGLVRERPGHVSVEDVRDSSGGGVNGADEDGCVVGIIGARDGRAVGDSEEDIEEDYRERAVPMSLWHDEISWTV